MSSDEMTSGLSVRVVCSRLHTGIEFGPNPSSSTLSALTIVAITCRMPALTGARTSNRSSAVASGLLGAESSGFPFAFAFPTMNSGVPPTVS